MIGSTMRSINLLLIKNTKLNSFIMQQQQQRQIHIYNSVLLKEDKQIVMNVFDRNLKKMHRNINANDANFKDYDYLKEETGYRLADRVFDIKRTFDCILDLGCSRGHVTKNLTKETVKKIIMLEMADKLLEKAYLPEDNEIKIEKIVHDEETRLPFDNDSLDLVVSNLSLHWVNDLPKVFKEVLRCLKKDSAFIGSMFAGDTLYELRVSLQLAELERKGGMSPHISPMTTAQDIGSLLSSCGYTMLTLDLDDIVIGYPSIFELLYDIKDMGESNCSWNRNINLSKDVLLAAQSIYKEMYAEENGNLPATYQILYFIAWKPGDSQPKIAKRGSGQVSLKDLGKLNEINDNTQKPNK